jgi:hypothetical protein
MLRALHDAVRSPAASPSPDLRLTPKATLSRQGRGQALIHAGVFIPRAHAERDRDGRLSIKKNPAAGAAGLSGFVLRKS